MPEKFAFHVFCSCVAPNGPATVKFGRQLAWVLDRPAHFSKSACRPRAARARLRRARGLAAGKLRRRAAARKKTLIENPNPNRIKAMTHLFKKTNCRVSSVRPIHCMIYPCTGMEWLAYIACSLLLCPRTTMQICTTPNPLN